MATQRCGGTACSDTDELPFGPAARRLRLLFSRRVLTAGTGEDMNDNVMPMKGRLRFSEGWPMLAAFALYWAVVVIFALTLASGILVA